MQTAAEEWTAYLATRCPRHGAKLHNGWCRPCAREQYVGLDESESRGERCQRLSDEYEDANWKWEVK